MNSTIALFLAQDGIINGAIYALVGVTLVLVFAVTRVIFVPQGEFIAWAALTVASLEAGTVPGTAWLLMVLGIAAAVLEVIREGRELTPKRILAMLVKDVAVPVALLLAVIWLATTFVVVTGAGASAFVSGGAVITGMSVMPQRGHLPDLATFTSACSGIGQV